MKIALLLLAAVTTANAGARCQKDGTVGGSADVCIGDDLYITYSDAPRVCTVLALVKSTAAQSFSYDWHRVRCGKPNTCVGQSNCWATAANCPDVSNQYADKAVFSTTGYDAGTYQIRMYDVISQPMAYQTIYMRHCTPEPTPEPTPAPTPTPPTHTCVEADPPLTYTKVDTVEMMEGWSDCTHNLKHIPSEWTQPDAFTCKGTSYVPEGTTFTLKCPDNSEYPCDWFVTHYHCPPCSGSENGGWPAILTTEGWERGSCGPRIATPFQHETAVYRRQVAPGDSVLMGPSVKPTKYMTFHMMPGADCESMSPFNCDTNSFCAVVEGQCTSYWCPRRLLPKPGPNPCQGACLEACN